MMENIPIWKFRRMHPGEMNIDPVEAEFFTTEALQSVGDALVRETIQNSLDARIPGEHVRVRFHFSGSQQLLPSSKAGEYFSDLWPHLEAHRPNASSVPGLEKPAEFLVIEDFGTRGLQGDPAQSEDTELDAGAGKNDFYYFWRNIGRSKKGATDLGRWGLGKTVFQWASRINSFYGFTVRQDDKRRLLMGQSVLRIHKVDGQRYYPYGYFGGFDGDFALPVQGQDFLARFCADFHVSRDNQSGLSIVIPYPDPEINPDSILRSVVHHYFFPILAGSLEVEVLSGDRRSILDTNSITDVIGRDHPDLAREFDRLLALARWGIDYHEGDYIRLMTPDSSYAPAWSKEAALLPASINLHERFNNAERLAFIVPVWVKRIGVEPVLSEFKLYLERDDSLRGSEEHFVRDGITVAGVRSGLQNGIRAIVSVTDKSLSGLLGDSENPAHTEWQERSPKFRNRYKHGASTLRYVKNSPRELVRMLTRPMEGRDYTLLGHLFSLQIPTKESLRDPERHRDEAGDADTGESGEIETVGKDKALLLQKLPGGFRLKRARSASQPPISVTIFVAYEVRRGNPFKLYQPPDFELDKPPIKTSVEKAQIIMRQMNTIILKIDDPDFVLTVRGFDKHRDLRIRVQSNDGVGA